MYSFLVGAVRLCVDFSPRCRTALLLRLSPLLQEADKSLLSSVRDLRQSYHTLLHTSSSTPGGSSADSDSRMLLTAFDGLFTHVYHQYQVAMRALMRVSMPPKSWRKVDMIREAGNLQVSCTTRALYHL